MQMTIGLIGFAMTFAFVGLHHQLSRIADALEKANQRAASQTQGEPKP